MTFRLIWNQFFHTAPLVAPALSSLLLFSGVSPTLYAEVDPSPSAVAATASTAQLKVLILGDSMSQCGFGKRLDTLFRKDNGVGAVFTYMACGTVPVSWLQKSPYANAKTYCGYWAIESVPGKDTPSEFQDEYGMKRGYVPKPHPVPKLETLLSAIQPDILVMQTGTNLLSLFRDGKTIHSKVQGPILRNLVEPFLTVAVKPPSSLKKIYWIGSPISGRVTKEVQQFVFEQLQSSTRDKATLIDSRDLVSYPYRVMARDREHFFGAQMDAWADRVFTIIKDDINSHPVALLPRLSENSASSVTEQTPSTEQTLPGEVTVKAKLIFKSKPLAVAQLLPYQESLVAFIYEVQQVLGGSYNDKEILVLHPAHIQLKPQPLDQFAIGDTFLLHLDEVDSTAWATIKTSDETGRIDLVPYIRKEDEDRLPSPRS